MSIETSLCEGEERVGRQRKMAVTIPRETWKRIRLQAVHEACTASDLVSRLIENYLDSKPAKAKRSEP
jgi:hypothetical protein